MHTMEELHFVGNCLKGSRPVLSFDSAFDNQPYLKVIKQLFVQTFGVPEGARKSKPFVDHVMSFTIADGKIWIRVYQINETEAKLTTGEDGETEKTSSKSRTTKETDINLLEIGPRLVSDFRCLFHPGTSCLFLKKQILTPILHIYRSLLQSLSRYVHFYKFQTTI